MIYALRQMRKSPVFTIAVVLTLALGIGATTAIFSLVHSVLLSQLPFEHASRLVWIWSTRTDRDKAFYSFPDFVETQRDSNAFDGLAAYSNWGANLSGTGDPERFAGARISAHAFEMMGVRAMYGRTPVSADGRPESARVAVLSHGLWQRRFGGNPGLVGKQLTLNGDSYTVVGVLPPTFVMPNTEAELFVPLVAEVHPSRNNRGLNFLRVFGRLKAGSSKERAAAELAAITRRLREAYPDTNAKHTDPRVVTFQDEVTGGYRTSLWVLLGAVGLVLLIACGNIANLQLARALTRGREVAIRRALGASKLSLIRQFLTESLTLSTFGGGLGVLLAQIGLPALVSLAPADLPRASEIKLDVSVLLFAVALTLLVGVVFGMSPAWHAIRAGGAEELRTRGAGSSVRKTSRTLLPICEVALAILLLICAGLFLKTFVKLQSATPGFAVDHLLLAQVSLPASAYQTPTAIGNFFDKARERLAPLPGVRSVAIGSHLPLSGANNRSQLMISGWKLASPLDVPAAQNRWVSADYFQTMGIPILQGREFTTADSETSVGVAIVDQTMAKRYWPSEGALGRHIQMEGRDFEIIGVAGNIKHNTLTDEPTQTIYAPYTQVTLTSMQFAGSFSFVLRTAVDPLALADAVRREIRAVDASIPASSVKTMDQFLARSVSPRKFNALLISIFATAALLLAAMGLYAVISFSVSARTNEIGVRMALGADGSAVLLLILSQALRIVLIGIFAGLASAALATRLLTSMLFETDSIDALTYGSVALLFVLVGTAAAYLPARRAMGVDPLTALRTE